MPDYTTAGSPGATGSEEVVDVLDDLLENARDGEYGFKACADEVNSPQLKQVFQDRASQCIAAGSMKGSLGADSALSMLEECERGEDAAVARYRKALKAPIPADVRSVVERQAQGAQRNHDQIKALRDQMRARA
ncbi:hypothetical protein FHT32_003824 [Variovorax sp. SG517]|uniref:PA2169 family four-helix-bundle protein n=1 Tax=Variovorax sp. SG517 TaxID=2587117 RepID=UPI00159E4575|nr:PA2169 family four-helix-bundle protein [Variovorax sp. SG517]NVM90167.1 hypothetical protein [Variovorax sp. SG517]